MFWSNFLSFFFEGLVKEKRDEVSEHSFECSPMRRSGVLHELGEFVYAEGNVWASKAQVLEASNERSILSWGR